MTTVEILGIELWNLAEKLSVRAQVVCGNNKAANRLPEKADIFDNIL